MGPPRFRCATLMC
ncbi:unnamed protein product [Linum tenue]|uniref:Uncharacterized protein n=1 Tax=Linum tenue TaxID=586396 RepID=A0AAV0N1G5_9ROSI|nr:unnamed protein product [Linum tenue]